MTHGIETTYRHVRFRSRLEATWAAMFDALDWRWEYEPVDLDGYVPDFVLMFPAGPVLVEVKPRFSTEELATACGPKICASGWTTTNANPAMAVGASWNVQPSDYAELCAGAIWQVFAGADDDPDDDGCRLEADYWSDAHWFRCHACHEVSVFHCHGWWTCLRCGAYAADNLRQAVSAFWLEMLWSEARNGTRWRPLRP